MPHPPGLDQRRIRTALSHESAVRWGREQWWQRVAQDWLVLDLTGGNFYLTLALLAHNVFGLGPESYGLLTALLAVGSLLGALAAARRVGRPRLRVVYGSALAFGGLEVAAGLMPTFALVGLMLIPVGIAALLFTTAANATVQLSVAESMRGRVMGLYMLLFLGATPLGAPLLGVLAENLGGRAPVVAGGVASVLSVLAVAGFLTRHG